MALGEVQCHRCPAKVQGNAAFREHLFVAHVVHDKDCVGWPCACPLPEHVGNQDDTGRSV